MKVKVINIIIILVNKNIERINIVQIVDQKKNIQVKVNHIHQVIQIQNQINRIQNHQVHHIQICLPYYIPIQFMK
jgi:hypothetical protein